MKKLFLLCLLFSGCAVAPFIVSPIVTGVVMWVEGEAHKYYYNDTATLYRATKHALAELNLKITRDDQLKNNEYYIIAGEKDKFKIKIEQAKDDIGQISVRINTMGDKPFAELLYKHIDDNLNSINYDNGIPKTDLNNLYLK